MAELLGLNALERSWVLTAGSKFAKVDPSDVKVELIWDASSEYASVIAVSSNSGRLQLRLSRWQLDFHDEKD